MRIPRQITSKLQQSKKHVVMKVHRAYNSLAGHKWFFEKLNHIWLILPLAQQQ
jgi:hypothetical protein